MFGRPEGILGRLGGLIMARTNRGCAWVIGLLDVGPNENVLEVSFGPGVCIELLAPRAAAGYLDGIDPSVEMVAQAAAPNADAIKRGRVDLRRGSVASLPFADDTFDKAVAINSMQLWPDAGAGSRSYWWDRMYPRSQCLTSTTCTPVAATMTISISSGWPPPLTE
jgi:SAM-dependent methyltransferase